MTDNYYGSTLADFTVGMRVEIHPATDAWMQGDIYGEVTKIGRKYVHVKSNATGRTHGIVPYLLRAVRFHADGSVVYSDDLGNLTDDTIPDTTGTFLRDTQPHTDVTATPSNVARWANMHRLSDADQAAREARIRRATMDASVRARAPQVRKNGYRGAMTRWDWANAL